jgi:antitoxin ParD1/3/4
MSIALTPEQEQLLEQLIRSGRYHSAAEVLDEALHLLQQRDQHYSQWVEQTRPEVVEGIEQLDRGEGLEAEQVLDQLRHRLTLAQQNQA